MNNSNIIISLCAYKEAENIVKLTDKIRILFPEVKILIINDHSGDNTKKLIKEKNDKNIVFLERPEKLGLGTAHKLSLIYAIKNNYKFLITLDADFSHDPVYLPELIKHSGINNFVIGSRFCEGGKSDYNGLRKIISICGNFFAKKILNIKLNEITTYYRVYSTELLKKLPFDELNAQGYSLGVRLVWLMKKLDANLIEVPIHFKDRNKGKSKIPRLQIFISFFDLLSIKLKDMFLKQKFYEDNKTYKFTKICQNCNCDFFAMKKDKFICLVCGQKEK